MAQQTRHSPLGRDRAPFEAATDPVLGGEAEAELLRQRLDAMAAVSKGLATCRRRHRWRRKRLGDMAQRARSERRNLTERDLGGGSGEVGKRRRSAARVERANASMSNAASPPESNPP